jgi:hypothetical protein
VPALSPLENFGCGSVVSCGNWLGTSRLFEFKPLGRCGIRCISGNSVVWVHSLVESDSRMVGKTKRTCLLRLVVVSEMVGVVSETLVPVVPVFRPPVNNMPFCRAELQKNVRNLHELWLEYEVGSGGRKPAKFFTPQERGLKTNKDRFCRRKVFWDCVRKHVDAGISAAVAIERIQDAYGHRLGVTALCLAMKKDLPQGHPNLRV